MLLASVSSQIKYFVLAALLFALAGCTTYGETVQTVLDDARAGNYAVADEIAQQSLSPIGKDQLLYYLERGMIAHLDGRYQDSNTLLEQAYFIADSQYQTELKDWLATAMTHPGNAAYKGQLYERSFLHYTKMLNYLMLAQQSDNAIDQAKLLDGARVENRRIQLLLDSNVLKTGDYDDAKNDQEKLFTQFGKIFRELNGELYDPADLVFRDQAFAHYMMGAMYEQYGELDNARISYQRAAELYEKGYAQQYKLDPEMTRQAWRDTVRVMQKAGGYQDRWPQLVKTKALLKEGEPEQLYQKDQAELLVVQHVDLSPQRKVLNMHLMINERSRQIVVRPVPIGSRQEQREQAAWFYILYADKGIYNLVRDFSDGSILNSEGLLFNSRATTLAPVWSLVEETGLDQILGNGGVRVAVPYYPIPYEPMKTVELNLSTTTTDKTTAQQKSYPMIKADSVAMLGLLQQVIDAQNDLNNAMARETLRNMLTMKALKDLGGLGILGSKLITASTTNADTRSWLLLPHHIRIQRLQLPAGTHQLVLSSESQDGQTVQQTETVTLAAGELKILNLRTFVPAPPTKKQ